MQQADFLFFSPLQTFCPLFHAVPWALDIRVVRGYMKEEMGKAGEGLKLENGKDANTEEEEKWTK